MAYAIATILQKLVYTIGHVLKCMNLLHILANVTGTYNVQRFGIPHRKRRQPSEGRGVFKDRSKPG